MTRVFTFALFSNVNKRFFTDNVFLFIVENQEIQRWFRKEYDSLLQYYLTDNLNEHSKCIFLWTLFYT